MMIDEDADKMVGYYYYMFTFVFLSWSLATLWIFGQWAFGTSRHGTKKWK